MSIRGWRPASAARPRSRSQPELATLEKGAAGRRYERRTRRIGNLDKHTYSEGAQCRKAPIEGEVTTTYSTDPADDVTQLTAAGRYIFRRAQRAAATCNLIGRLAGLGEKEAA